MHVRLPPGRRSWGRLSSLPFRPHFWPALRFRTVHTAVSHVGQSRPRRSRNRGIPWNAGLRPLFLNPHPESPKKSPLPQKGEGEGGFAFRCARIPVSVCQLCSFAAARDRKARHTCLSALSAATSFHYRSSMTRLAFPILRSIESGGTMVTGTLMPITCCILAEILLASSSILSWPA